MNHFEELLSKYSVTTEDITFEYEGLTDEELDAKFEEVFGENTVQNPQETQTDDSHIAFSRTYELSHDDIRCALYQLLAPIEEADNTEYYIMDVFDNYFVYSDWYSGGKLYGQAYNKTDDTVSFIGERYELFMELLTAEEKAQLDNMRSTYDTISNKLKGYEDAEIEAKKTALLLSDEYASVKDTEEFNELVSNHEEITYEDLRVRCDSILLDAVKNGRYSVINNTAESNKVSKKQFANPIAKRGKPSRYGNLFSHRDE